MMVEEGFSPHLRQWLFKKDIIGTKYNFKKNDLCAIVNQTSDGLLVVEYISSLFPSLIDVYDYHTHCISFKSKQDNWKKLNQKVLHKLKCQLDITQREIIIYRRSIEVSIQFWNDLCQSIDQFAPTYRKKYQSFPEKIPLSIEQENNIVNKDELIQGKSKGNNSSQESHIPNQIIGAEKKENSSLKEEKMELKMIDTFELEKKFKSISNLLKTSIERQRSKNNKIASQTEKVDTFISKVRSQNLKELETTRRNLLKLKASSPSTNHTKQQIITRNRTQNRPKRANDTLYRRQTQQKNSFSRSQNLDQKIEEICNKQGSKPSTDCGESYSSRIDVSDFALVKSKSNDHPIRLTLYNSEELEVIEKMVLNTKLQHEADFLLLKDSASSNNSANKTVEVMQLHTNENICDANTDTKNRRVSLTDKKCLPDSNRISSNSLKLKKNERTRFTDEGGNDSDGNEDCEESVHSIMDDETSKESTEGSSIPPPPTSPPPPKSFLQFHSLTLKEAEAKLDALSNKISSSDTVDTSSSKGKLQQHRNQTLGSKDYEKKNDRKEEDMESIVKDITQEVVMPQSDNRPSCKHSQNESTDLEEISKSHRKSIYEVLSTPNLRRSNRDFKILFPSKDESFDFNSSFEENQEVEEHISEKESMNQDSEFKFTKERARIQEKVDSLPVRKEEEDIEPLPLNSKDEDKHIPASVIEKTLDEPSIVDQIKILLQKLREQEVSKQSEKHESIGDEFSEELSQILNRKQTLADQEQTDFQSEREQKNALKALGFEDSSSSEGGTLNEGNTLQINGTIGSNLDSQNSSGESSEASSIWSMNQKNSPAPSVKGLVGLNIEDSLGKEIAANRTENRNDLYLKQVSLEKESEEFEATLSRVFLWEKRLNNDNVNERRERNPSLTSINTVTSSITFDPENIKIEEVEGRKIGRPEEGEKFSLAEHSNGPNVINNVTIDNIEDTFRSKIPHVYWRECFDSKQKKKYYLNLQSLEAFWNPPASSLIECVDENSGHLYIFNTADSSAEWVKEI